MYVSLLDKFCTDGVESLYCMFSKGEVQVYLGVIYRPEHVSIDIVTRQMKTFIRNCKLNDETQTVTLIVGDFNFDYSSTSNCMKNNMRDLQFSQLISTPTCISGATLDHMYIDRKSSLLQTEVMPCYFSDHSATLCVLPTPGDEEEVKKSVFIRFIKK